MSTIAPAYRRHHFTWLAYFSLAYYAYIQASLGPIIPFLRDDLHMSYTTAGFHFSAFAFGMILSGLTVDGFADKWGRRMMYWGGGFGMALGTLLFMIGQPALLTIFSAFLMGTLGSMLLIIIQSTLSDLYGPQRAIALTEANIGASISASFAPLLVGNMERLGIGWQGALIVPIIAWVGLFLFYRNTPIPLALHEDEPTPTQPAQPPIKKLPMVFWGYWLVIVLGVAVEWSVIFWGADFLVTNVGISKVDAASLMTVYFVATVIGRISGSRLAMHFPLPRLILLSAIMTLIGFLLYWLALIEVISILGLFIVGLGVANLFPLTLSIATGVVRPRQSDRASSRISLGAGFAILAAPQTLGAVADASSIKTAYGMVVVILVLVIGMVFLANSISRQSQLESTMQKN